MSKPTKKEKGILRVSDGDSEAYHSDFDTLLEEKLMKLDPEWMKAMSKLYEDSGNDRWCA